MKNFDIINVVGMAYRKTWEERAYLLRMAAIPFLVKLACFTILASYFEGESLFMTAVVLLPSFIVEGWFLAHWARTIMTGGVHRWPFRVSGNEIKDRMELLSRGRGIMAGMVAFALINFMIIGYMAGLFSGMPDISEGFDPQNPDPRVAVVGVVFMVTSMLLFRFIWVHIPLSINVPIEKIFQILQPMKLTFRMVAVWMICVIPAFLLIQMLGEVLVGASGEATPITQTGFMVIRIVIEMVKNLIVTAGMGYVFLVLLQSSEKK